MTKDERHPVNGRSSAFLNGKVLYISLLGGDLNELTSIAHAHRADADGENREKYFPEASWRPVAETT